MGKKKKRYRDYVDKIWRLRFFGILTDALRMNDRVP